MREGSCQRLALCHRSAVSRFPLRHLSTRTRFALSPYRGRNSRYTLLVEFFSTTIDAFSSPPLRDLRARRNRLFPALLFSCCVMVRSLAILHPSFGGCELLLVAARCCG